MNFINKLKKKLKEYIDNKYFEQNLKIEQINNKIESLVEAMDNDKSEIEAYDNKNIILRKNQVEQINKRADLMLSEVYKLDNMFLNRVKNNKLKHLTNEQLEEINNFWKPYEFAYKNNSEIQKYLYSISGVFDPSYISWGLHFLLLKPYWEHKLTRTITLKSWTFWFFNKEIPMPKTYIMCEFGGIYFDENKNIISKEEAIKICCDIINSGKKILLKPSDGVCGNGIKVLGGEKDVRDAFNTYKDRFLCQVLVKNHPSYVTSNSLNTLRITTFVYKKDVKWIGTMFRMGCGNNVVDNWHAGGISCAVNSDGVCNDYAISLNGEKYYSHPDGYEFAGRKLFNYKKAHELAMALHKKMPYVKYIAWDIAINEDGEPVVLEFGNPGYSILMEMGGFNTYLNKEIVKEILDEYLVKKFYYTKAIFDWDYREYRDNIVLIRYCGFDSCVKVPKTINGKKVSHILNGAIKGTYINEIYISNDIKLEPNAVAKNIVVIKN